MSKKNQEQSLAQRRAAHALSCIKRHEQRNQNRSEPDYGNYVSYVQSLPPTIVMNGLGQAMATLLSKANGNLEEPHGMLYANLQDWLCGNDAAAPYPNAPGGDTRLIEAIVGGTERQYLHAQAEALAYLIWLKKFANAYLQKGRDE